MQRHEAMHKLDQLTDEGRQAVLEGDLPGYIRAQNAEALIELVAEEIALAGIDEWKHLRDCLARKDAPMLGEAVLSICAGLIDTLEEERGDLCAWAIQEMESRRPCSAPFDLGDAA